MVRAYPDVELERMSADDFIIGKGSWCVYAGSKNAVAHCDLVKVLTTALV